MEDSNGGMEFSDYNQNMGNNKLAGFPAQVVNANNVTTVYDKQPNGAFVHKNNEKTAIKCR